MNTNLKIQKTLVFIWKEFIYGGHILSLGASGIIWSTISLLDLPLNIIILIIPYLISQIVYSYNHFREIKHDQISNPERTTHLQQQRIRWVLVIYTVVLFVVLLFTNISTALFAATIVIGGILYTDYFKNKATHYITGFKNLYTSTFGASTIFLITFYYNEQITPFLLYLVIFIFLRWMINSTFFDIKDIKSDRQRCLKTIPVKFGKKKTLYLLHWVNLLSLIPLTIGIYTSGYPKSYFILCGIVFYDIYYLIHASYLKGKSLRNLSYVAVDADDLVWAILVLFVRNIL